MTHAVAAALFFVLVFGQTVPDVVLALLVRERDRQVIRAALPGSVVLHCVSRTEQLRQPFPAGPPTAVLAELVDATGASTVRALVALHRRVRGVPICLYIPLRGDAVREVMRFASRRIVTDVIMQDGDDLRTRLRHLLRRSPGRSETASIRMVWRPWTPRSVEDVVASCIAASGGDVSVDEIAHHLNRSVRTLERQMEQAGLPPVHRVLAWCRLLRAAYRLQRRKVAVKTVAAELGYPSPHALAQHLHRYAGLTLTGLRAGGFKGLTACVRSELLRVRADAARRARNVSDR